MGKNISGVNQDRAATVILGVLGAKRITHSRAARGAKINRIYLSAFLNRHVNLLPVDLEHLFDFLGVKKLYGRLSAPAEFIDHMAEQMESELSDSEL